MVILLGAGTLIGAGILDFWLMCLWAIAGAIIGDGLSYWLGHHFEYLTARWRWFRLHPDHLQKGIRFFEKYGDLSVALGRFFGPIRAIVPLVAGLMHMPPRRFYLANVLSALVWAPAATTRNRASMAVHVTCAWWRRRSPSGSRNRTGCG